MSIVAIETACPPGSVAVHHNGTVRFRNISSTRRTTETFATELRSLLQEADISPVDVTLVATTTGPGSFTGLRIGVTAAKVFAHAVGAKVLAVNTLELIAAQVAGDTDVEVVLNAQRGELFACRYKKCGSKLETIRPTSIIPATEWIDAHIENAVLTGEGLKRIVSDLPESARVAPSESWTPSAAKLAELAASREIGQIVDTIQLAPTYYRRSAAEEKADQSTQRN